MKVWNERNDVWYADPFYTVPCGSTVQSEDEREWNVIYAGIGGIGVIEGTNHDYSPSTPNEDLPEPTAMLREPYRGSDLPCVGHWVVILTEAVKPL